MSAKSSNEIKEFDIQVEVNSLICAGKKIHDVLIDAANAGIGNVASK